MGRNFRVLNPGGGFNLAKGRAAKRATLLWRSPVCCKGGLAIPIVWLQRAGVNVAPFCNKAIAFFVCFCNKARPSFDFQWIMLKTKTNPRSLAQASILLPSLPLAVPAFHARRRQRNSNHRKSKRRLTIVLTIKYLCVSLLCAPCGKITHFFIINLL